MDDRSETNIDRIARALAYLLRQCPVSVDEFSRHLKSHGLDNESIRPHTIGKGAMLGVKRFNHAIGMMAAWYQDKQFVDALGDPLVLPLRGERPSLHSLFMDVAESYKLDETGESEFEDIVDLLVSHASVRLTPSGDYEPISPYVRSHIQGPAIQMALQRLADVSETVAYNAHHGGGRFDRVASIAGFPSSEIPRLKKTIEEGGMNFLSGIDCLLEAEQRRTNSTKDVENVTRVAVGVFLTIEDDSMAG